MHLLFKVTGIRIFVDAVVDEAKLASIGFELEIRFEVLGVLFNSTFFSYFLIVLTITDTFRVVGELGEDHHRIFKEVQSEHLAENFYGVLQLLTQAGLL